MTTTTRGDRWLVRGSLETAAPLHVGSGETTIRPEIVDEETGSPAQVSAVAVDWTGRPYLPGSSLKGVLRSWAAARVAPELLERVFGSTERGGSAVFYDAPLATRLNSDAEAADNDDPFVAPSHWSEARQTGVVARVAIDRLYGTASHRRLFYVEMVPPSAVFDLEVTGDAMDEDEMALVLAALGAFDGDGLALGSRTGDGWGRLRWHRRELRRLDSAQVAAWLDAGAATMALAEAAALPPEAERSLDERAANITASPAQDAALQLEVELRFDGPFLVRDVDPARAGRGLDRPDAVPRRDARGAPFLPASSFRGSLRSQAERILRTLGGPGAACGIDAPRKPCDAVESMDEVRGLCPACLVFGAAGWRAPLGVGDFTLRDGEWTAHPQHFIAVDRFTGGAAEGRKFMVESVLEPRLKGRIQADLSAMARAGCGPWAFALLALVARDLVEGDIAFGAGAAHGYGACKARVAPPAGPALWAVLPEAWRSELGLEEQSLAGPSGWPRPSSPPGRALAASCEELERVARESHAAWRNREETKPEDEP